MAHHLDAFLGGGMCIGVLSIWTKVPERALPVVQHDARLQHPGFVGLGEGLRLSTYVFSPFWGTTYLSRSISGPAAGLLARGGFGSPGEFGIGYLLQI